MDTKHYAISQSGRYPSGNYNGIAEARKVLRDAIREEQQLAKRRYGRAYVHRFKDSATITLAEDERSALWTSLAIISA